MASDKNTCKQSRMKHFNTHSSTDNMFDTKSGRLYLGFKLVSEYPSLTPQGEKWVNENLSFPQITVQIF